MTEQKCTRASYRMSRGRMELVAADGHVLLSRSISEPKRLSPTRRDNSQLFRIRREFTRFIIQHGIEIVEGGAA